MESFSKIIFQQRKGYREVFIYYSRHGAKFRESTKVKVINTRIVDIKGVVLDESNQHLILQVHQKVEQLIEQYVVENECKPPVQWLRTEFNKMKIREHLSPVIEPLDMYTQQTVNPRPIDRSCQDVECDLFHHWNDFILMKRACTRTEGTIKRYNNLLTTIRKFSERYGSKGYSLIKTNSLTQVMFNDLLHYMVKEHEFFRSSTRKPGDVIELPEIGLANETIIKRLTDLVEYLGYCKRRKQVAIDMDEIVEFVKIAKFKLGITKQCDSKKWELTLTTEELQFVINLDHYESQFYLSLSNMQRRYLDIFIFMCLQGTAPIDTQKVKQTDIVRGKLVGDRSKTRSGFKVELDPISDQILQKYSYNLTFTDQALNEAVKKMFVTIFELYRPYFEDKYDEEYQMTYSQRKSKGDKEFLVIQHKGLFAEAMTGRRTFITNLNETADETRMRENMRRTGHARIQTHLGYQKDRQTGSSMEQRSLFGVSKIEQSSVMETVKSSIKLKRRRRTQMLNDIVNPKVV
jgi:hypothetical protein